MSHGHSHGGGHGHSHGEGHSGGGGHSTRTQQGVEMRPPQNFIEACASGAMGVVMAFWDDNAINLRDQQGATAIHWAALQGHVAIVRFLLDNGAKKDIPDNQDQTPLHYAATMNRVHVIHVLLDAGFDAMKRDSNSNTAHGAAAVNNHLAALVALQQRCPLAPDVVDLQGNTALAWGAYNGRLHIVRYCHEVAGIPVKTYGKFGRNPLHWAAREGNLDVCLYLMEKGLDPEEPDEGGFSPIRWAKERNHYEAHWALQAKSTAGVPDRNVSTLSAFTKDSRHLIRLLIGLVYIAVCYFALLYAPPVFICMFLTGYLGKNPAAFYGRSPAVTASRPEQTMMDLLKMPDDMREAFEGPSNLFGRECAAVFFLPVVIFLQLTCVFSQESAIPLGIFWVLLTAKVLAGIAKALSSRDVMKNGSVKDFPLYKAIEDKKYEDVFCGEAIFDTKCWLHKPCRAYYCRQLDRVVKRYDSWTTLLDCPISHSNARWFFFFLVSLTLAQILILTSAWQTNMVQNGCSAALDSTSSSSITDQHHHHNHHHHHHHDKKSNGANHHDAEGDDHSTSSSGGLQQVGWCTSILSLALNGGPCPPRHSWLGGVSSSRLTWAELFMGNEHTRSNTLTILLAALFTVMLGNYVWTMFHRAMNSISFVEGQIGATPCQNGGMMPIKKPNGYGSVFGEGTALANEIAFFLGADGNRWEDVMAMPALSKPPPTPHPLVVPPEDPKRAKKMGKGGGDMMGEP